MHEQVYHKTLYYIYIHIYTYALYIFTFLAFTLMLALLYLSCQILSCWIEVLSVTINATTIKQAYKGPELIRFGLPKKHGSIYQHPVLFCEVPFRLNKFKTCLTQKLQITIGHKSVCHIYMILTLVMELGSRFIALHAIYSHFLLFHINIMYCIIHLSLVDTGSTRLGKEWVLSLKALAVSLLIFHTEGTYVSSAFCYEMTSHQ